MCRRCARCAAAHWLLRLCGVVSLTRTGSTDWAPNTYFKQEEFCTEFVLADLRTLPECLKATEGCDWVRLRGARALAVRRAAEPKKHNAHRHARRASGGERAGERLTAAHRHKLTRRRAQVFNLAADMGGMGFIQSNAATLFYNNLMIDVNMVEAARKNGVTRFFYSSSACVYPETMQETTDDE